jgi:hypothetical protein
MYDKTYRIFIVFGYLEIKQMGGRYYPNRKSTVEASCDVSIFKLKKWGMLSGYNYKVITWTRSGSGKKTIVGVACDVTVEEPYVRFLYGITNQSGDTTDYDYEAPLTTTPCYFGGVRYWFLCPMCYSRVGALYLSPGHVRFRCRHCNDLSYNSRNAGCMGAFGVACRKADKLRSELKRWTYRGLPTRKVRRLQRIERKTRIFGSMAMGRIDKLTARISRR